METSKRDTEDNQSSSTNSDSSGTNNEISNHSRKLQCTIQFSYGVGHVLNDLTASMWFSYLLVFLHQVNNFNNMLAGNLMLIGQVSDALFTPFIGFESDRTSGFWKLGRRKSWHLLGTICVMASFPFLFSECITCSHAPNIAQFVYYAPFVVIFQFGWAATQISHLSFSSDITPCAHERVSLQSIRNVFTILANLSIYGIFLLLFYLEGGHGVNDDLSQQDAPKFQHLSLISIGIGVITNIIFHLGTKEKVTNLENQTNSNPNESSIEKSAVIHSKMNWKDWLKQKQFYQIALLYMATRLYINVSQVYFPMYVTEPLQLTKSSIALLPLVSYVSSFVMSMVSPYLNRYLGRKPSFVLAAVIGLGSCTWMYFIEKKSDQVYAAACLLGLAGSLLLITSLSMTSDLIANNTESGAFVFGAMSFTDKLANGVAVLLIQYFHPCEGCCPACEPYYRNVQVFVPGGALVIALIALGSLIPQTIGLRGHTVVQVMESPVGTHEEAGFEQCSCGQFYLPPNSCSACGFMPGYNTQDLARTVDDSDDDYYAQERKPLLTRANINTPTRDLKVL
ncbi:major facilitator superfamily domain-containing protein 12-like isoform X2 [Biomphalaria pfeifferi]|uniref:Major facilitator superfamily domain-containing protein 12-like isoform X2 n=1 Tax=Biomphalaria pfeifferi TaxID=112525 RepID=A0AAD8FBF9_BIOPF|nr:major facilitator superfamily domain-containing protein 12-like isoform X2 [Biomphalaria pfeifferi]